MFRKIASLGACYAFLWGLSAGIFLAFCRFRNTFPSAEIDFRSPEQPFSSYLLSLVAALRLQMHNTWLFLAAFAALGIAGLLWFMAEKWQQGTKWNMPEAVWMAGFGVTLAASAVLYGLGTNGVVAKKFSRAATISDVLSIGFAVAVPLLLWSRVYGRKSQGADGQEEPRRVENRNHSVTLLGLDTAKTGRPAPLLVDAPPSEAVSVHALSVPSPDEENLPAPDGLPAMLEIQKADIMETVQETAPTLTATTSITSFREQLAVLNAGWQRIEETGREVETWFQQQQERVVARLQRAGATDNGAASSFSHDFLEQKLRQVDAEWATIFQTVREMNQWLEHSSRHKELAEGVSTE